MESQAGSAPAPFSDFALRTTSSGPPSHPPPPPPPPPKVSGRLSDWKPRTKRPPTSPVSKLLEPVSSLLSSEDWEIGASTDPLISSTSHELTASSRAHRAAPLSSSSDQFVDEGCHNIPPRQPASRMRRSNSLKSQPSLPTEGDKSPRTQPKYNTLNMKSLGRVSTQSHTPPQQVAFPPPRKSASGPLSGSMESPRFMLTMEPDITQPPDYAPPKPPSIQSSPRLSESDSETSRCDDTSSRELPETIVSPASPDLGRTERATEAIEPTTPTNSPKEKEKGVFSIKLPNSSGLGASLSRSIDGVYNKGGRRSSRSEGSPRLHVSPKPGSGSPRNSSPRIPTQQMQLQQSSISAEEPQLAPSEVLQVLSQSLPSFQELWNNTPNETQDAVRKALHAVLNPTTATTAPTINLASSLTTPTSASTQGHEEGKPKKAQTHRDFLSSSMSDHDNSSHLGKKKVFSKSVKGRKKPTGTLTHSSSSSIEVNVASPLKEFSEAVKKVVGQIAQMLSVSDTMTGQLVTLITKAAPPTNKAMAMMRATIKNNMSNCFTLIQGSLEELAVSYLKCDGLVSQGSLKNIVAGTVAKLKEKHEPKAMYLYPSYFVGGKHLLLVRSKILAAMHSKARNMLYGQTLINRLLSGSTRNSSEATLYFCGLALTFLEEMKSMEQNYMTLYEIETAFFELKITAPERVLCLQLSPPPETSDKFGEKPCSLDTLLYQAFPPDAEIEQSTLQNLCQCASRFSDPQSWVQKLILLFNTSYATASVKLSIIQVLYEWTGANHSLCNSLIVEYIKNFTHINLRQIPGEYRIKFAERVRKLSSEELFLLPPTIQLSELNETHTISDPQLWKTIMVYDPKAFADQLTLIDRELYNKITPIELLDQAWSKEKLQVLAQNTSTLMERTDNLSFWVASIILMYSNVKERTKVLAKFIGIGQALWSLGNFNSMMGILAGLNLSPVSRLKHTFEGLQPAVTKVLDEMAEILSPMSSFKSLRLAIEECRGKRIIPFLGVHLSDLTFTEEGNPDFMTDEATKEDLINVPKHQMIYNSIENCLKHQGVNELDKRGPLYPHLIQLPRLTKDDLYALSLEREPRAPAPTEH